MNRSSAHRTGRSIPYLVLAAEQIPVILTSTMDAPDRDHEGYDGAYRRAAELYEAGVKFAISGGSGARST